MERKLFLLPGWVISAIVVRGERIYAARQDPVVIWVRHPWVLQEILEIERDGFIAAAWARWLERHQALDTLEATGQR